MPHANKKNHLAKVCLQAARQVRQVVLLQDNRDGDDTSSDNAEGLLLAPYSWGAYGTQTNGPGSRPDVLPFHVYNLLKTKMHPTNKILTGIGHGKITPRGTTKAECSVSRRKPAGKKMLTFYITDQDLAILGQAACEELDLSRRVESMTPAYVSIRLSPTR